MIARRDQKANGHEPAGRQKGGRARSCSPVRRLLPVANRSVALA